MKFKKVLSVFLSVLMLMSVLSAGLVGFAAGQNMNALYQNLAEALKKEHVRDLTNYTISNVTLNNDTEGFDTDANGFAYAHRVTAADNTAGEILKAANIFYQIAESLISTTYGIGCYDASTLVTTVVGNLKSYFNESGEDYYEDFYGKRYFPTPEEIEKYNETVSLLASVDREVTEASLTSFNIYFMKKDYYNYYNVETILKYFMGGVLKINAGNWYHSFAFIVKTDIDTALRDSEGINNLPDTKMDIRTAVYEFKYYRTYNETQSKAFYAFRQPSADTVVEDFGDEFGFSGNSADLSTKLFGGAGAQASALFIKNTVDTTTLSHLLENYALFTPYINAAVNENGDTWDAWFAKKTEAQLAAEVPNSAAIVAAMEEMTSTYSNDALVSLFGDELGNMITLTYILKPISKSPERVVRGSAKYVATADKLNQIVRDMDALVYDDSTDTAKRVGKIVKQFFNTDNELFAGTAVAGLEFDDLNELVHYLVTGLLFRDSIVNMLIELLYPLVADLLAEKVVGAVQDAVGSGLGNIVDDLLTNIINQNDLALYPEDLAARINKDYPNKFPKAVAVLSAAGHSWDNVNFDAISWGVEEADYSEKGELFIDALCAGLGGFVRALVTVMCGDAEYSENAGLSYDSNQFDTYYDKKLINILGITGWLRSQGGYTKVIVPLFRVLGIPEMASGATYSTTISGYVTPADYHKIITSKDSNGNYRYGYSLRLIVAPIIYWVENILAERPFETIWKLIPNLVYFFTRQGSSVVSLADIKAHNESETRDADSSHGGRFNAVNGRNEWEELATYNVATILDNVAILIDITVPILFNKNFTINIGSLKTLIDKDPMFESVNGLLNEVLNLEYVVGPSGVLNTVAYADAEGNIVMPDSFEYGSNPDAYPIELQYVYANEDETEFREAPDETHSKELTNPEMLKAPYKIPQLQEAKLTSVTTLEADGKTLKDPNAIGILNEAWNTIDVKNPGVVLMYVLRFVLSALGYKYDISDTAVDPELPQLIECFGLDISGELFQGLKLSDIIYNVMLHPDEAICALLELFYSNENGNRYNHVSYTYPLTPIEYHEDVLLNETINPGKVYGIPVRYTQYWTKEYAKDTVANAEILAGNIVQMLGLEGFEDGFGPYLKNLLDGLAFNDDLMNTLFNTIYQLLAGLNDTVGFDIEDILDAALDVTYKPAEIGKTLEEMVGRETPASKAIKSATSWEELFSDGEGGLTDVTLDWGINNADTTPATIGGKTVYNTTHDTFLRTASALLSPVAFVFRFLLLDQHLDILGLIDIDAYAGYQYAFIGLLEMLSCPGILSYEAYYNKSMETTAGSKIGDANTIYYLLQPILNLLDKVYSDPLTTVLDLIPNLMFYISIGAVNDILNNLVHFAYVLLDILKPILNGYDLLNGLISNLEISGVQINLSLPLDVDFNGLISDLLDGLLGDTLTIEGVTISLPYIDFHTLCAGTLTDFDSAEKRNTVRLNTAGGGDLLTALLRLVFEVLFMDENKQAISDILSNLIDKEEFDQYDTQTLHELINELFGLMEEYEVPDMLLFVVYFLVDTLTPVSGKLAPALKKSNITITELFAGIGDNPQGFIGKLMTVVGYLKDEPPTGEDEVTDSEAIIGGETHMGLFDRLREFFAKLKLFFQKLFGLA